ncbi:uncharacterized conserved protein [Sanguibacter keddieii DSM 10542]|uniref:Uncharacterized conserved protein n=1 Tax=Sanguibacter keddieii (strain ATCC 51767 / DSM 10542 / NCFB 3025 / ST-74) TaxID=446469 RepID=D1BH70_SANKS|nr:YigZ family protein [Sanguibacter keddieii]ACZ21790.1 uncharacterized conserved protein [Sanguibacter keddieii DSM 10542]
MDPSPALELPADLPVGLTLPSTVDGTTVHEIVVKRSRFITRVAHVASVEAADEVVAAVRKEYWDARHSCVALVVGQRADRQRSSDDGEPSGTAGVPMLEVLRQRGLTDVVAVVTRYFGGVLLGAGGLVRAYSTSVSEALDRAVVVSREPRVEVAVETDHVSAGRLENVVREWCHVHRAIVDPPAYGAAVVLTVRLRPRDLRSFEQLVAAETSGTALPEVRGWHVTDIPALP